MIKQVQFRGRDDDGNIFCQPLLGSDPVAGLEKTAEWKPSKLHPRVRDFVKSVKQTDKGIYILVNALGAGEYWGSNVNGDLFPEAALIHSPPDWDEYSPKKMKEAAAKWDYGFPTFMNAYPYKHHVNKDPSRAFGEVILAVWNPTMHRVELVVYLDRAKCKKWGAYDVIERIERGEFPDVSMGCKVPFDICTICGNKSKTKKDYCIHAQSEMNRIYPDGRKVAVRNDYPKFFDISFVFIGADKSAKVLAKLASVDGMQCLGGFCAIPRPSVEVGEKFSSVDMRARDLAESWEMQKEAERRAGSCCAPVRPNCPCEKLGTLSCCMVKEALSIAPMPSGLSMGDFDKELERRRKISNAARARSNRAIQDQVAEEMLAKTAQKAIKRQTTFDGHVLKIEVDKGDIRKGKSKSGKSWSKEMQCSYGYIPKTKGKDGETCDIYLAPEPKPGAQVYVVKQLKGDGSHDEDKVMLGFSSKGAARSMYLKHIPPKLFGGITELGSGGFNAYLKGHEKTGEAELDKLAEAFLPRLDVKSASHSKLSEIIKSVPAGPFRKAHLPRLEKSETDIPNDVLDQLARSDLSKALAAPSRLGMVLKPREFQRIIMIQIGEKPLADSLDKERKVFAPSREIEDLPFSLGGGLGSLLALLAPLFGARSVFTPALQKRITIVARISPKDSPRSMVDNPVMKKVARLYNGYRRHLVKKAAAVGSSVFDPQLAPVVAGGSMVQAFAGGIEKTAASVLGPESLAYLIGAHYEDRDFHLGALAQSGLAAA